MKAIQTEFDGILYRSRLEARWAVFFNACNLEYIYEPDCFLDKNNKKYTPDFYLPKYNLYIEIKPDYKWMNDEQHIGRYKNFEADLLVLSGGFPNLNVNMVFGEQYPEEGTTVVFCPNSKYEPLFFSGYNIGQCEDWLHDDFIKEILTVKHYRFWK